jgi:hypothetical protein
MTSPAKHKALGATFTFDSVAFPFVESVSLNGVKVNMKKLSTIDDQWNTYAGTSSEPGSVKVKAYFEVAAYATITALLGAPVSCAWTLLYDTTEEVTGNGVLESFDLTGLSQDEYAEAEFEIKNTGAVTFTNPS